MMKGVIFDMDGVLIDSHPIHKRAWQRFLESVGLTISDHDLDFVLDGRKREEILRHFLGTISAAEVDEYGHRKEEMFREEALNVLPISGVVNFLARLVNAGVPIAVASCASASRVDFILTQLGLKSQFSAILTGDDVRLGKPDPTIFRKAAHCIHAPCPDTLVVEDAVSGVLAAKAAGMKCLAISSNGRGEALLSAGADVLAPDFRNLDVSVVAKLFC